MLNIVDIGELNIPDVPDVPLDDSRMNEDDVDWAYVQSLEKHFHELQYVAPEELDIDQLLREGLALSPVPESPETTLCEDGNETGGTRDVSREHDDHRASHTACEDGMPELYSFEDFSPIPVRMEPQPRIYSNGFWKDTDFSLMPNHVNGKEFVRSKTLPVIPIQQYLPQLEITREYEEQGPVKRRQGSPSSSRSASSGSTIRPLLSPADTLPPALPGEIRYRSHSADRRAKFAGRSPFRRKAGTAWAPDDEEDLTYDPLSPNLDDSGSTSPGTPQLFYTTPPKQMASTPCSEGRSRLDRSGSTKGGLSRLARRLSHKEKRGNNEERKKALRQRSVSLDCRVQNSKEVQIFNGDGRRSLMGSTTPEPVAPEQDNSSLSIPASPSLPTKLSRSSGSSSPNLAGRLSRRASGSRRRDRSSELADGLGQKGDRKKKSYVDIQALFDAVEQQDMDKAKNIIETNGLNVNYVNSEDLTPLDIAVMSNHVPMARMLMSHGARENPKFQKVNETRALTLINLVNEAERRVEDLSSMVGDTNKEGTPTAQNKDHERYLSHWEYKHKLLKKMKQGFDAARVPDVPTNVSLSVASATSLLVKFAEPLDHNGAVVTRYKVEWSCFESFGPLSGEQIIEDIRYMYYEIPGLTQGNSYYVRVRAWNMKGYGPAQISNPSYAVPSSWREVDSVQPRLEGKLEQLDDLFNSMKQARPADSLEIKEGSMGPASSPMHPRKSNMRRSLKNLFASAPKFQKSLKRGVYMASLMYNEDRILVTNEDNLPLLEVDENFSSTSLHSDFHWLMKIACTWEDVKTLKNDMDRCHNSSTMLFRNKLLQGAAQLQSALGVQDLGLFFHKPVRDSSGSIVLVTVNHIRDPKVVNTTHVKWMPLSKVQKRMTSSCENLTTPDFMLTMLPEMMEYHRASCAMLPRGLYLGYLKLKSSVDLIKIMVPEKMPNVVPYVKIQECPNVSREEWQWIRNVGINEVRTPPTPAQSTFQRNLVTATKTLLESLGINEDEAVSHRIYDLEVIELNEDVSMILLLPPIEGVCSIPGHSEEIMEKPQYLTKPVQAFEMTHMCTYQYEFISRYSRLSSLIEMDTYLAQQSQREAFSADEMTFSKDRVELLGKYQHKLEEAWKGVRWTMDIITYARDKSVRGGLPLSILYAPPPSPNDSPTMDRKDTDAVASSSSSDMGYHSDRSSGDHNMEEGREDKRSDCSCASSEDVGQDVWLRNTSLPGILRVYAAYCTGLTRGTSVKLHVTPRTTSREVINLVVQQLNRAVMIKGASGPYYGEEQLDEFCLVAVIGARERVLRDDYQPLQLQNPWTKGRLFVRQRRDTFAALEQGHVTSV